MATIISGSKVYDQMFKCFNCGHKTVSLSYGLNTNNISFLNIEDDDLTERDVLESLEALEELQDEWLAACANCGWSDN